MNSMVRKQEVCLGGDEQARLTERLLRSVDS